MSEYLPRSRIEPHVDELERRLREVEAQRDALREALEAIVALPYASHGWEMHVWARATLHDTETLT